MRPDELPGFRERHIAGYAQDMVENAGYAVDHAHRKAAADVDHLFAGGLDGSALFVIESDGEPVGSLVMGEREHHGERRAFVYDLEIVPERRGHGLGRGAMLLAEAEARARGLDTIELNVFGGNGVARGLYRSLGYRETAVTMTKEIG